jgi:hypothetical protein
VLDRVTFAAQTHHLGGLEAQFLGLGDHLSDPGVPRDTQQETLGSRTGLLSILDGFWDPLGTHFGVMFVTSSWFYQKWLSFWMFVFRSLF